MPDIIKSYNDVHRRNVDMGDGTYAERVSSISSNVAAIVRDACETWPNADVWEAPVIGSGDFVIQRGNTAGAGWIEISKDPSGRDTETVLTMRPRFRMPLKLTTMVSMTHRNAGEQIFSQEFVSDDASYGGEPIPAPEPVEILNASQATTTITINFASPPPVPFRIGQVVSVYGFVDTRLNVNSATIATTPTPTQVTLVGNDYAFTSTTIASTPGGGTAFIERVDLLGGARNGVAIVRGNGTVTNTRDYVRAQGGLARPSGTLAGAHSITTGTDTSTALAGTAPFSESWSAPLETALLLSRDGIVHADRAPDANASWSGRFRQSQVVPNPERPYLLRFRVRSTPSLTRPVAKIVSISKAGSTTTTIVTDGPHECVTGQYVGFYGVNNQTNFANQTTGLLCTVVDATTLTVVHGTSATATSYGGFLMRVHGQQALGGAIAQVAQSVSRTGNIVTMVGNGTWATTAIGNIVDLIGVRDTVSGADLGIDGSYVVRNLATTTMTLEPVAGIGPTGADFVSVNCGGGVVQRLGVRLHGVVATDYSPLLTEPSVKGLSDAGEAIGVTGTVTVSGSVAGTVAVDAAIGNPVTAGLRASNANITAMSAAGDSVGWMGTMIGAGIVKPYALPEAGFNASLALTTTTAVAIQAAGAAGIKRHLTALQAINTGGGAVDLIILDGTTERWRLTLPVNVPVAFEFPTEITTTAATALNANLSAAGTVRANFQGYTAP